MLQLRSEPYNVLFLCTGNSARSILAEAILNRVGGSRFRAFSAGSFPKGQVNPHALTLLRELGHPTAALRSKSWDEFAAPSAARLDFIITVCDSASGEVCPIWPGHPMTVHWGLPDPAEAQAFAQTYRALTRRIDALVNLPIDELDPASLLRQMQEIGQAH